jgi:hypothetical protein
MHQADAGISFFMCQVSLVMIQAWHEERTIHVQ